jgi:hypothetical protein
MKAVSTSVYLLWLECKENVLCQFNAEEYPDSSSYQDFRVKRQHVPSVYTNAVGVPVVKISRRPRKRSRRLYKHVERSNENREECLIQAAKMARNIPGTSVHLALLVHSTSIHCRAWTGGPNEGTCISRTCANFFTRSCPNFQSFTPSAKSCVPAAIKSGSRPFRGE